MDRKKWKTLSQEITCAHCGTQVPRSASNQSYCSLACQQAGYKYPTQTKKCVVCNESFETKNRSVATCSKLCALVYNTVNQQIYTDKEIIHLALLNKGYGFTRFAEKVSTHEYRLMDLREFYQEETHLDLFSILQDPDGLIVMLKDEWIAQGKPPKPVGGGQRGNSKLNGHNGRYTEKRMKETYARYEQSGFKFDPHDRRTSTKVKVYPPFNWGPCNKRQTNKGKKTRSKD